MVIVELELLRLMPGPATNEALTDDPFNVNPAPAPADAPMIVICGLVEDWLSVMLDPATKANAVEDAVFAVPEVAPPAVTAPMDTRADWLLAEMLIVLAPVRMPILAPAVMVMDPVEPFRAETTEALAAGAGTEIVTVPAPTPTEAIPAPEKLRLFAKVPVLLLVLLAMANIDTLAVCTLAEILMVLAPVARPIPAPAARTIVPVLVAAPVPKADTTFALAAGAGTEMVTLPLPTPTEAIPAPEKFNNPENVPAALLVVFPNAVSD